jgi:ATP:cob(I)alamin adenosyltransferase
MSIYTKTGDDGYTSLLNGKRVHKFDLRVELMGMMDEFSSYLGLTKLEIEEEDLKEELEVIQKNLSTIMAQIAYGNSDKYNLPKEAVPSMEKLIDKYEALFIHENKFIIPGKYKTSALLDVCRAIVRRVERYLLSVDRFYAVTETSKLYINRTSDFLYAASRYIDFKEEIKKQVLKALGNTNVEASELNLSLAKNLMEAVEKKAEEIGLPVVIAVSNEWGNTIAVHFMDGALPGSFAVSIDKAYTSAVFRMSTEELGKLSQSGQPFHGINTTNSGRIVTFGGGIPLTIKGKVMGAIGVSGGSASQDTELANYGINVFKEMISSGNK